MYTVLLVDDEQSVLESLQQEIYWQQLGFDKIYTANDGIQAQELLRNYTVDLMITDIKMPRMDGLILLTHVCSCYPHIHCILLTAYGEFEFAKQALALGVENYLLKPFDCLELLGAVEKAVDNIYQQKENTRSLFRNNILYRWANNTISSQELAERSNILDVNLYLPNYCTICIQKLNKHDSLSAYVAECRVHISERYISYTFQENLMRQSFIIGGRNLSIAYLSEIFLKVAQEKEISSRIKVSFGPIVDCSDEIPSSYGVALSTLDIIDFSEKEVCLIPSEDTAFKGNNTLIQTILDLFHEEDNEKRTERFHALAMELYQTNETKLDSVSSLAHSIFVLFEREFPNKSGIQKQIYERIHLFSSTSLTSETFISSIMELLEYSYLSYRFYFNQLSMIIQSSINYIQSHSEESLSIKEFCNKNKMHTAYLGYLFKKETGMFFNNYLTQYRICCALRLLEQTTMSVNEIAKKVGFSSTSYFIACFKKQVGLSPVKYRSLNMK